MTIFLPHDARSTKRGIATLSRRRPSVRPSVCRSVCLSVRPSVRNVDVPWVGLD